METSGSDGEHDQEKLHRFLEARIPTSEETSESVSISHEMLDFVYGWGMGKKQLFLSTF